MDTYRTILAAILVIASAPARSNGWFLNGLPSTYEVDSIEKTEETEAHWKAKICLKAFNRQNPGDQRQTLPTKKSEGEIQPEFFKKPANRAALLVDWQPIAKAKIHWFDSSFTTFDNGGIKDIETKVSSVIFQPDFKGYKVCSWIPFEKKHPYSYVREKLTSKVPIGIVGWQSDFVLEFYKAGKNTGSSRYATREILTPVFGDVGPLGNDFSNDIKDIFNQINVINMLLIADDSIEAKTIEEFMKVRDLRSKKKRIQEECGAMPDGKLLLVEFIDDVRHCLDNGLFSDKNRVFPSESRF